MSILFFYLLSITSFFLLQIISTLDPPVGECVICNSNADANCAINPANIQPQKCTNPTDSCYSRVVSKYRLKIVDVLNRLHDFTLNFLEQVTYRGCFNDLDQEIQTHCLNDTSPEQKCNICENVNGARGCNSGVCNFTIYLCSN